MTSNHEKPRSALDRRSFLKATALGGTVMAALPAIENVERTLSPSRHGVQAAAGAARQSQAGKNGASTINFANLVETWQEPWVWRPSDWPGQQLHLHVVEDQNPGPAVGSGNIAAILFSYGGDTPGPTIRMRGDEDLSIKLRNLLGRDYGRSTIGPAPDPKELPPSLDPSDVPAIVREDICLGEHTNGQHAAHVTNLHTHGLHVRPGLNSDGSHSDNVILRVMSQASYRARKQMAGQPRCEFLRDLVESGYLRDDEVVGEANFEFRIGNVMGDADQPHPPGTHWYHPHSHGATHNQVASGMAGFLIVEGETDDAINETMGHSGIDMALKEGPYDYRERLVFMQRVLPQLSQDPDAPPQSQQLKAPQAAAVNGSVDPALMRMRPGAVERWRVLNGSVDGRGYKHFMVLEGQLTLDTSNSNRLSLIHQLGSETKLTPVPLVKDAENPTDYEARKQQLYMLATDGVPLIDLADGEARYTIKDLAQQNKDIPNPMTATVPDAEDENQAMLTRIANAHQDHVDPDTGQELTAQQSIHAAFVRPNEVYLVPANRADLLFRAPAGVLAPFTLDSIDSAADLPAEGSAAVTDALVAAFSQADAPLSAASQATVVTTDSIWRIDDPDTDGGKTYIVAATGDTSVDVREIKIYSLLALSSVIHADTFQQSLQQAVAGNDTNAVPRPQDIIVAHLVVSGETIVDEGGGQFDVMSLVDSLPVVPPYHQPIVDDELVITAEEADALSNAQAGDYRTRTVNYSGWGAQDYPLITTRSTTEFPNPNAEAFREFVLNDLKSNDGALQDLVYTQASDGDGNLLSDENDDPIYLLLPAAIRSMAIDGRKFNPNDPLRPRMLVDSAEEWALFNTSSTLYGETDPDKQPDGQYKAHYLSYPMVRGEGHARFEQSPTYQVVTRAIDHPFHIHQNPFWVTRIEVPDADGNLHNILEAPRWQDVVWIPRNGGRVVFRSRFPDYVGRYVHHCHILLHEDNGMMTAVEATPFMDQVNYEGSPTVTNPEMSVEDVNALYPPPSPADSYLASIQFVDNNPMRSQSYPGFEPQVPTAPDAA